MKRKFKNKLRKKKNWNMNTISEQGKTPYFNLVLAAMLAYTCIMSVLSILRYESFTASVYDLGIMIQTIWNTANGYFFQDSINMGYPMMRFWMAHWEFIYAPIAFIYKIFATPYTIFIIHTLVIASGALPVYWLAREKLGNEISAFIFAIGYLLYPAVHNGNLMDVHGVTFAAPFLLFAFYYLQKEKMALFSLFALIAITCREDSALLLIMMGAYSFFIMKKRKAGLWIAVLSFLWFFVWYKRMTIRSMLGLPEFVIMEGAETHWDHLANIKHDPMYLIKFLAKKHNIQYVIYLFGPLAFISLFSPATLLIAAPIFVINLLSSYYYTHDVEHYYSATITPFIFVSAIYGLQNLLRHVKNKAKIDQHLVWISMAILLSSVFFFFIKSNVFDARSWKITEHHRSAKSVIKDIPQNASVSAMRKMAVHAAERHEIYVFNDNIGKVDYILYDFYAPDVRLVTRKSFRLPYYWPDNDSIRKVLNDRHYGIIRYEDGVCLFKKGAAYDEGLRKLAVTNESEIKNLVTVTVDSALYFRGFREHEMLSYYIQPEKLGKVYWKKAIHFTAFWNIKNVLVDSSAFVYRLQHENMMIEKEHQPVFGVYPISHWQTDDIVRDEIFWELPENYEPGEYQVLIKFKSEFVHLFNLQIKK